jgi:hypothetical protein
MDKPLEATTVAEVASATVTEALDAARGQYDRVLATIRRNPLQAVPVQAS